MKIPHKSRHATERFVEDASRILTRILPAALLVPLLIYPLLRILRHDSAKEPFDTLLTFAIPAVAGMAIMMFRFLEDTRKSRSLRSVPDRIEYQKLRLTLNEYRKAIEELTTKDKEAIVRQLHQEVRKSASEEFLSEIRNTMASRQKADVWEKFLVEAAGRLDAEIAAQGRRGTLNMILGVVTALSGVVLLSYVVLGEKHAATGVNDFLMSFIPRLSIVGIIEVFAYFFLRLYKGSLSEIKYFQNEATNLESRFAALRIALDANDPALLTHVVNNLLTIDRNPILDKERTTLELEKEKLDLTAVSISLPQAFALARDVLAKKTEEEKPK